MFSDIFQKILSYITDFLYAAPLVLICITLHEYAHGYVAYKFGDNTAKEQGRLTLNPLKHIDPLGAIFFLIFHFGWAKPVPVYSLYFKNPKRDMAIVAIAGPTANFLLAIISIPLLAISAFIGIRLNFPYLQHFFILSIYMNIGFAMFNLIPIPPLDGSRILMYFLPANLYTKFLQYEQYAFFVLIGLLFLSNYSHINIIGGPISFVANLFIIPAQLLLDLLLSLF